MQITASELYGKLFELCENSYANDFL